jgi:RNA binding activity-knot of a chromodomain
MKNGTWYRAKIIDVRLSKDYDLKKKKCESSYDYYVHYEGFNRRMDEWIPRNRIETSDDKIVDEPALKKKSKKGEEKKAEHQENDEHEGMDLQSLLAHE